jgi:hypothetical protein
LHGGGGSLRREAACKPSSRRSAAPRPGDPLTPPASARFLSPNRGLPPPLVSLPNSELPARNGPRPPTRGSECRASRCRPHIGRALSHAHAARPLVMRRRTAALVTKPCRHGTVRARVLLSPPPPGALCHPILSSRDRWREAAPRQARKKTEAGGEDLRKMKGGALRPHSLYYGQSEWTGSSSGDEAPNGRRSESTARPPSP